MNDALATISVEQLTNAVNSLVNAIGNNSNHSLENECESSADCHDASQGKDTDTIIPQRTDFSTAQLQGLGQFILPKATEQSELSKNQVFISTVNTKTNDLPLLPSVSSLQQSLQLPINLQTFSVPIDNQISAPPETLAHVLPSVPTPVERFNDEIATDSSSVLNLNINLSNPTTVSNITVQDLCTLLQQSVNNLQKPVTVEPIVNDLTFPIEVISTQLHKDGKITVVVPSNQELGNGPDIIQTPILVDASPMKTEKDHQSDPEIMDQALPPLSDIIEFDVVDNLNKESTNVLFARPNSFYCVDCNSSFDGSCPLHGKELYTSVFDTPILSRAILSLPSQLYFKDSVLDNKKSGVWTRRPLNRRTKFGPLIGESQAATDSSNRKEDCWEVFNEEGWIKELLYTTDKDKSNWMMYVQKTRTQEEQNIVAYQENDQIFFVTCKDIESDMELLLWFSNDYAKLKGVPTCPDNILKCTKCKKQFKSEESFKRHSKCCGTVFTNRKWDCAICGNIFSTSTQLWTHMHIHDDTKPFKCKVCPKTFSDRSNLRTHSKLHTGVKEFECDICLRCFTQKAHLISHKLTHTGEKKLKCRFCPQRFARASDMKTHEYKHTLEKVFVCEICGKQFNKTQNYKKHKNVHAGIKAYKCNVCQKGFSTPYHATRHQNGCEKRRKTMVEKIPEENTQDENAETKSK